MSEALEQLLLKQSELHALLENADPKTGGTPRPNPTLAVP